MATRILALFLVVFAAGAAQRPPDVRYEPTPPEVVEAMLDLAGVKAGDVLYDLGCGDGRIPIAAVRRGARGVCVDIDIQRIAEARVNARRAGVEGRIAFRHEDLMTTELREATVVTLFLSAQLNDRLHPKLRRELRPGSRVVSYWHSMSRWKPDRSLTVKGFFGEDNPLFLWTIP
jgi:SAM-dependent methyltransferase